jgi:ABC-type molybdate transport system permease subunit
VIFPSIAPALLTGFAMAFARAVGEYGSVIFIAGNMPMVSEITPLIIIGKLEQYDYAGATAVAVSPSSCCGHQRMSRQLASSRRAQAGTTESVWVRRIR